MLCLLFEEKSTHLISYFFLDKVTIIVVKYYKKKEKAVSAINNKETKATTRQKRVSGGSGKKAAKESSFNKLKRLMQLATIGEERYYPEGKDITSDIVFLSEKAAKEFPEKLVNLLQYTRLAIGLRHAPLFGMLGILKINPILLKDIDPSFFLRPSDIMDMVALYFQENSEAKTLPKQLKKLIEKSLNQYDLYQFAKYGKYKKRLQINLVDVLNLVHPKPKNEKQKELFEKVIKQELPIPETWETMLSNSQLSKKEAWEYLMEIKKLPALATIRNIRNMLEAEVKEEKIIEYIQGINTGRIFPAQILSAVIHIDSEKIKKTLLDKLKQSNANLKGKTLIILDISGSMGTFELYSGFLNSYAFRAISVLIALVQNSEDFEIVLTSGDDYKRKHESVYLNKEQKEWILNGELDKFFALIEEYKKGKLGWGGIFTKQVLNWIKKQNKEHYNRVVVISDSQDMDFTSKNDILPAIAKHQYINNIAAYKKVGYSTHKDETGNTWEEITTYSSKLVDFILLSEIEF